MRVQAKGPRGRFGDQPWYVVLAGERRVALADITVDISDNPEKPVWKERGIYVTLERISLPPDDEIRYEAFVNLVHYGIPDGSEDEEPGFTGAQ